MAGYTCVECGKVFSDVASLTKHVQSHYQGIIDQAQQAATHAQHTNMAIIAGVAILVVAALAIGGYIWVKHHDKV